jgi:hypothetical protein
LFSWINFFEEEHAARNSVAKKILEKKENIVFQLVSSKGIDAFCFYTSPTFIFR